MTRKRKRSEVEARAAKRKKRSESIRRLPMYEQRDHLKHGVSAGGVLVVACLAESRARNIAEIGAIDTKGLEVKYEDLSQPDRAPTPEEVFVSYCANFPEELRRASKGVRLLLAACRRDRGMGETK